MLRVLVVEDDEFIRGAVRDVLESENFEVQLAKNGREGLTVLQNLAKNGRSLPDLILLDLMMPIMDGFVFHNEMLNDKQLARVPIVVMSADGNVIEKKKRIGAAYYLKKPFDMDTLLDTVRRYGPDQEVGNNMRSN